MRVCLLPGVLVAIEGIDGAGKTTQARRLASRIEALGIAVVRTKEPTDGPWGRTLRASAANGRLAPEEELHAFMEDRRQHVAELIAPSCAEGKLVIVDRYYFSTAAYQGARGHDPEELLRRNEAFAPAPELLVLLAVEPRCGVERIAARGDRGNLFEREEDLARSAAIFAALSRPYLLRLDGSRDPEALGEEILAATLRLPAVARALSLAGGQAPTEDP